MKTINVWRAGNNHGKGWYYRFMDGTTGWVMGWSASERKVEERKHGTLLRYEPA